MSGLKLWGILGISVLFISCGSSDQPTSETSKPEAPAQQEQSAAPEKSGESDAPMQDLAFTSVRKEDGGLYSAMLNGAIVFRDLKIEKDDDGKEKLYFPKTPGKGDKEFSVVYLKDRGLADQIKEGAKTGKTGARAEAKTLKITEIRWKEFGGSGKLKGFADVTFNDAVEIKGMKLLEGKNGLWLAWPSVKRGNDFYDLVFSPNEDVRKMVEAAVKKEAGL